MQVRLSLILWDISLCAVLAIGALVFGLRAHRCRIQRDLEFETRSVAELRTLGKREKRYIVLAHICGIGAPMPIPPLFLRQFIELLKDVERLLAVSAIAAVIAFVIKKLGDIELKFALRPIRKDMTASNWVLLVAIGTLLSAIATIGVAVAQDEPLKKEIQSLLKGKD
jgi:hypothetical protein